MKLLYVTDVFPPRCGGSGWSVYLYARCLRRTGHEVTVISLSGTAREYDGFQVEVIPLTNSSIPFYKNWRRENADLPRIGQRLRDMSKQHDLVHAHHKWSALAAGVAEVNNLFVTIRDYWPICICSRSLYRSGSICSMQDFARCSEDENLWKGLAAPLLYPWYASRIQEWQTRLQKASKIFCISAYLRDQLSFRFPAEKLAVLPNFAEKIEIGKDLADRLKASLPDRYLLYAGRLERNKGAHLLPEILKSSGISVPIVIAGEGSLKSSMQERFQAYGIDAHFTGYLEYPQLLPVFEGCDFVLFPSLWAEPLGRVLIEAAMLSKPAVAWNHPGGHREILRDPGNAILVDSLEAFARAVNELASNEKLRLKLGDDSRKVYETSYSPESVMPILLRHYEQDSHFDEPATDLKLTPESRI
jgi:glycogen synthase